jgi:hypothetical protein
LGSGRDADGKLAKARPSGRILEGRVKRDAHILKVAEGG